MLTFPEILIGVFGAAGLLLVVILLAALLPRRDQADPTHAADGRDAFPQTNGRNGEGFTR